MSRATEIYRNRIALVFDYDDTLAPSTFHTLLSHIGLDPDKFEKTEVDPRVETGWDTTLARYYGLLQHSRQSDNPVTEDLMKKVGEQMPLFDHVEAMFDKVRAWASDVVEDVEVEFYMLTAGMAEIPEATPLAKHFDHIWAGACGFNEDGEYDFVKRIVTHADKVRYLTQLSKGLHLKQENPQPENVYQDVDAAEYHVPFDQIIYVGDGASDMAAFSIMADEGGLAIGVVLADSIEEWRGYDETHADRRIQNLAIADYSEGSELMRSLKHAVHSIANKIALRRLSEGE